MEENGENGCLCQSDRLISFTSCVHMMSPFNMIDLRTRARTNLTSLPRRRLFPNRCASA